MQVRRVRRSAVLALAATLAFAGTVLADTIGADGDDDAGVQNSIDLGSVAPGATITHEVDLTLFCAGIRHVDPGQIVTLSQVGETVPEEGGSISATSTTVGPVSEGWAIDLFGISGCTAPLSVTSATPSIVTIVAPTESRLDYVFGIEYGRSLSPTGVSDLSSVTGFTMITFIVDVEDSDSTAPTLHDVPGDFALVTGDPNGVTLGYVPPTATDDRDPAPDVTCDPAPGEVAPVGTTFVTCTATDAAGNVTVEGFWVTVRHAVVAWDDPVHGTDVTANRGRNLPVKARAWLDGKAVMGAGELQVWSCGSGATLERAMSAGQSDAGRWMAGIDTSGLAVGCHTVALVVDGTALGSFTLNLVDPPSGESTRGKSSRP